MVAVCLVSFRSDVTGFENSAGWAEMGFQSNRRRGKLLKQQHTHKKKSTGVSFTVSSMKRLD